MSDVVVIGGGPAGSAAAIRLTQAGLRVRLYEKSHFPRHKLCGGFLSAEAIPELEDLGLLEAVKSAGAWPIYRVLVSSPSGMRAESPLSNPAFSISRYSLDKILLDGARASGARIFEGEDGLAHEHSSRWTVRARGRATPDPLPLLRRRRFYGMQALFENVSGMTDQVELDTIRGGYFGLARQENNQVNICGLIEQSAMRHAGSDLDLVMRNFSRTNPLLRARLKDARRVSAWQTVGPVVMGLRRLTQDQTFFVGDAACVVDPFAGEGMAMSLVTGRILKNAFEKSPDDPAPAYERLWHDQFDRSRRLQTAICWAIDHPWWQELLSHSCRAFPELMRWLTDNTRPYENIKQNPNLGAV